MNVDITIVIACVAIACFFIGFIIGMHANKPEVIGTIVINQSAVDKPVFELHFDSDPEEFKSGTKVGFLLDIR